MRSQAFAHATAQRQQIAVAYVKALQATYEDGQRPLPVLLHRRARAPLRYLDRLATWLLNVARERRLIGPSNEDISEKVLTELIFCVDEIYDTAATVQTAMVLARRAAKVRRELAAISNPTDGDMLEVVDAVFHTPACVEAGCFKTLENERIEDRRDQVFILHLYGVAPATIAEELNLPLRTIRNDLHRLFPPYELSAPPAWNANLSGGGEAI